ncbi:Crp/Fnr family transcriptional regulator [Amycolatopsis mediterranei]|uniref:Crp/Fnr family transcriptional regulator n=1 Tax=Amycolatopsis mediterranei TaxID=33910 RepID=UPI0034144229
MAGFVQRMTKVVQPGKSAIDGVVEAARATWAPSSFLARLQRTTLDRLLDLGEVQTYSAGERIITEGDGDSAVHLLLTSYAKVTGRRLDGGEALLAIRVGGDLVGEFAAIDEGDKQLRMATVTACGRDPVVALGVEADPFHETLAAQDLPAQRHLMAAVVEKTRAASRQRVDNATPNTRIRLARALLELARTCGDGGLGHSVRIRAPLTQLELGTLVGVSKATAERALRELREARLVDTSEKYPIIRDVKELAKLALVDAII